MFGATQGFSRFSETNGLGFCLFNFIASNHCLLHNSSAVDRSLTLKVLSKRNLYTNYAIPHCHALHGTL